tara:strand:- start:1414 stop:1707 length:294 start_codon:yes stop_codon:yes gene_type:complete
VTHRFTVAGPLLTRFMDWTDSAGVVSPWRTIYLHPAFWDHPGIRAHELAHIEQIDRDGWRFWPRCIWYVLRYGYWRSPYEIEARAAGDRAITRELPF